MSLLLLFQGAGAASPTRGRISFTELEVPGTPTRGQISFAEFEVPLTPTRGRISWAEFQTPNAPFIRTGAAKVVWVTTGYEVNNRINTTGGVIYKQPIADLTTGKVKETTGVDTLAGTVN